MHAFGLLALSHKFHRFFLKLKDACAIFEIEKLDLISSSKLHQLIFGEFVHKLEAEMGELRLIAL